MGAPRSVRVDSVRRKYIPGEELEGPKTRSEVGAGTGNYAQIMLNATSDGTNRHHGKHMPNPYKRKGQ